MAAATAGAGLAAFIRLPRGSNGPVLAIGLIQQPGRLRLVVFQRQIQGGFAVIVFTVFVYARPGKQQRYDVRFYPKKRLIYKHLYNRIRILYNIYKRILGGEFERKTVKIVSKIPPQAPLILV